METFNSLLARYPALAPCLPGIGKASETLVAAYRKGGRAYICGNGGSDADARHMVGELMKGFEKKRPVRLPPEILAGLSPRAAEYFGNRLQGALPAHSLSGESSLLSAIGNDTDAVISIAQQIYGYGRAGDVFIGISTSGNAANICLGAELARAMGMATIALTGRDGGLLAPLCGIAIQVPADATADIQEMHLPVYHAICRAVEASMFAE